MGDERKTRDYEEMNGGDGGDDDGQHVLEWEEGLPDGEDVTPLSFPLISPGLLNAFSITAEPARTLLDVNRATQNTLTNLRRQSSSAAAGKPFSSFSASAVEDPMVIEADDVGEPSQKVFRRLDSDDSDSAAAAESEDQSAKTVKRPRLVWTPQLHKRFVDVVTHLGIKNVVPKTIMQLMNVEGLTRENVASHLQKYRLYLKRMHGVPGEGAGEPASSSDHLFPSTPAPQSLHEQQPAMAVPMHMPAYAMPTMIPMPMFGMPVNGPLNIGPYQNDLSGSISYPHHATPSDK